MIKPVILLLVLLVVSQSSAQIFKNFGRRLDASASGSGSGSASVEGSGGMIY